MNKLKNQKGFTIIEVVLVLAIAGLIFLMVFIALPALQRSQRDTARKNDASTVSAAIQSYMSNGGKISALGTSSNLSNFYTQYVKTLNQYEQGNVSVGSGMPGDSSSMVIKLNTKCENGAEVSGGTPRNAAVFVKLESGNGANYCVGV